MLRQRELMFGPDAGNAGERSFCDFFRLPPTQENRRQSVTLRVEKVRDGGPTGS